MDVCLPLASEGNTTSIIQDCSLQKHVEKTQDKSAAGASLCKDLSKCMRHTENCLPTVGTTVPIIAEKGLGNLFKVTQLVTQIYTIPKPMLMTPSFTARGQCNRKREDTSHSFSHSDVKSAPTGSNSLYIICNRPFSPTFSSRIP